VELLYIWLLVPISSGFIINNWLESNRSAIFPWLLVWIAALLTSWLWTPYASALDGTPQHYDWYSVQHSYHYLGPPAQAIWPGLPVLFGIQVALVGGAMLFNLGRPEAYQWRRILLITLVVTLLIVPGLYVFHSKPFHYEQRHLAALDEMYEKVQQNLEPIGFQRYPHASYEEFPYGVKGSVRAEENVVHSYYFTTQDEAEAVLSYYRNNAEAAGYACQTGSYESPAGYTLEMLLGTDGSSLLQVYYWPKAGQQRWELVYHTATDHEKVRVMLGRFTQVDGPRISLD
jgi:hypothetical protein